MVRAVLVDERSQSGREIRRSVSDVVTPRPYLRRFSSFLRYPHVVIPTGIVGIVWWGLYEQAGLVPAGMFIIFALALFRPWRWWF